MTLTRTQKRKAWLVAVSLLVGGTLIYSVYLLSLFRQLESAFQKPTEFLPTRLYSDVTRIASPQTRGYVLSHLENLAYKLTPGQAEGVFSFSLRPLHYPEYLLPEGHPTLSLQNQTLDLKFSGNLPDSPLESIEVGGKEIPEFYLEPELVATLSRSGGERRNEIRDILKFQEFPDLIWKAIISIEDQHYLDHNGLDPRGLARAIWINLKTRSLAQGGSTITQQLVKNLMERRGKNIFRKLGEIALAFALEVRFGKEQILERYLNEVYLGQSGALEIHGVSEGAKYFFGKRVQDLNLSEAAMMAGLIRGPAFYSPYKHWDRAKSRMELVIQKMVETGNLSDDEAKGARETPIRLSPPQTVSNKAPHFTDYVKAELIRSLKGRYSEEEIPDAGLRVYTTLDLTMNRIAQQSLSQGVLNAEKSITPKGKALPSEFRLEGALAAMDHTNGYIRALIGSRDYERSTFNRTLNMKRQAGSTFKPLVYLSAILKGYDNKGIAYGSGYPIEDAAWKLTYDGGRQTWSPKNYEKEFLGWIPMRTALAHSINTCAAKVATDVGYDRIVQLAHQLGIESELSAVPSISLGALEVSPVELLRVYGTLANRGSRDQLTVIRGITLEDGTNLAHFIYNPSQVIEPGPTDLMTHLLQEVFTEGTAHNATEMGLDRPAAGKTGTTNDYRDSWFAGYTPQLTSVVWVGLDQGNAVAGSKELKKLKIRLTGATTALPIWVQFIRRALEGTPPTPFHESEFLRDIKIDRFSGQEAGMGCPSGQISVEKYLTDHQPKSTSCENSPPPTESEHNL